MFCALKIFFDINVLCFINTFLFCRFGQRSRDLVSDKHSTQINSVGKRYNLRTLTEVHDVNHKICTFMSFDCGEKKPCSTPSEGQGSQNCAEVLKIQPHSRTPPVF